MISYIILFSFDRLKSHQEGGDIMNNFCDHSLCQEHPLFSTDPNALQIILNYNDVEICNPLGSKAKVHKLAMLIK